MELNESLQAFTKILHDEFDGLVSVVLFGSFARGAATKDSDVDLLVILETAPSSTWDRMGSMIEIRRRSNSKLPFMFIVLTRAEAMENRPIFLDMTLYATVLFDKEDFFRRRLEELKRRLAELGSKRIVLPDGRWYWDLKPDLKFGEEFTL